MVMSESILISLDINPKHATIEQWIAATNTARYENAYNKACATRDVRMMAVFADLRRYHHTRLKWLSRVRQARLGEYA